MNFNLIILSMSFYILKISLNTFLQADLKETKLDFAVHMFAGFPQPEPWSHLVIFSYMWFSAEKQALSCLVLAYERPSEHQQVVVQACGLFPYKPIPAFLLILSGQLLPHGLSQTSTIKQKNNLCTDVGYLIVFILFHFFKMFSIIYTLCVIYFSHTTTPFLKTLSSYCIFRTIRHT